MSVTLAEKITVCAKQFDADIVAFGGADRFAGTPAKEICPSLGTVICLGFRVLRGSHLGIEEGSTYYQYMTTGVETMEETVMPMALLRVSAVLEDAGFMAYPQKKQQMVIPRAHRINPEVDLGEIYVAAEELSLDFEDMAVRCGAGERGLSGAVLTKQFGPFVRWCCILTDAVLPETPVETPSLCDKCGACIAGCPGHAISAEGVRDDWQCAAYYQGANRATNPFMPPDAYAGLPNREAIMNGTAVLDEAGAREVLRNTYFYPPAKQGYVACICGRACDRACYAALEARGVLQNNHKKPYRRKAPWRLPEE